jgi:hypothetical protein
MSKEKLKAREAEHRASLMQRLDQIRMAAGAVHENTARQVFAEALLYLVRKSK